jgi:hypothetical protein
LEITLIVMSMIAVAVTFKQLHPLRTLAQLSAGEKVRYKRGVVYRF